VRTISARFVCRSLVDRANDWLHENNDVEVKSCETVTWLSHDAVSLSAGSELMVLSKPVAPPVVNTHCYRGLRYEKNKYQLSVTSPRDALHRGKRAANKGGRSVS